MSSGWEWWLTVLRGVTERKLLAPLQTHGWTATVESEAEQGEYLVVKAERAGVEHRVAAMYSSATDNAVHKALAPQLEHISIKDELYKLDSLAYGIATPVSTADEFHGILIAWNNASATGKFAPNKPTAPIAAQPPKHRTQLSEAPIEAIWLVDHVVIHEMLHLLEPTHSERFTSLLDMHYPSWREVQVELNALPLGAEKWQGERRVGE